MEVDFALYYLRYCLRYLVHQFRLPGQFPSQDPFRRPDSKVEWLAVRYYRDYMMMYLHYCARMLSLVALKRIVSFCQKIYC